ncbi:Inner membrane protein YqiK [Planctomycetales bacterium 10988]|nr:Inner membrane protein YqiK [Planctomycetales bacterium 10988]
MGSLLFLMLAGVGLIFAPWVLTDETVQSIPTTVKVLISLFGALLVLATFAIFVFTRLYRKASANQAFVRTGQGGAKVILDGGALFIPVMHQIIPISLETMRLNVERRGPHALITKDNLRVDLSAEFYIKVQANTEDILQAARSLGGRSIDPGGVSELVQEKLISALRTVAATKDLVELHSKRDEFASAVQQIVTHDLSSNGLTLESVTISALDQTNSASLEENNVFDAQGLRKIAEITQRARVERNNIERSSEQEVVATNVETRKRVLDMERDEAEFEAEQRMQVANFRSGKDRETREYSIEQEEVVARREIAKRKAIELSDVERTLAVEASEKDKEIALVAKSRDFETAEIEKGQAVEVAKRSQEVAVAMKERERAAAEAEMLKAESERESANQEVKTVEVTAEARREAEKKLIAAKQTIEENRIREETEADVMAYMKVKEAEAERQAADMQYEAKLRLAEGDSQSAKKRAEGEQALKMVDVQVDSERVKVEQSRVEVERESLANKQEFEEAALNFELEKLRIDAERDVRVRSAEAMSQMLSKANMQIFGDPETMGKMSQNFMRAASVGIAADGFLDTLPGEAKQLLDSFLSEANQRFGKSETPNGSTEKTTTTKPSSKAKKNGTTPKPSTDDPVV